MSKRRYSKCVYVCPSFCVAALSSVLCISCIHYTTYTAILPVFQVDLLGLEQLTSGFGALTCIRGLAAFLGPPLGGFVIDNSGTW